MPHALAVEVEPRKTACGWGAGHGACTFESHDIHRYARGPWRTPTASAASVLSRPGAPLPPGVRSRYERSFGTDLSGVRVHADPLAALAADQLNADAWTSGQHIVMGAGRYALGGDQLLAHELTHVVQQRTSRPVPTFAGDNPAAEVQADRVSARVASGAHAGPITAEPTGIAREPRRKRGVGYEAVTTASEQEFRRILAKPVPAGSIERRTTLISFLEMLPVVEKARLLTQLSNPQDPLAVLLRRRVDASTVPMVLEVLRLGSGGQTAKRAPERMTDEALKAEFLSIMEAPIAAGRSETSFEDVVAEERSTELYAEEAQRGLAYTTPDPATEHEMDLDFQLHQATQKFDYVGADLEHLKSKFERPPVNLLGGGSQGYYRTLQVLEGGLSEVGESAVKSDAANISFVSGPQKIEAPYLDPKRLVLAVRYPVMMQLKSGATKTYIFEIWWFADGRNEYNVLAGFAERAASFNPSPEARFFLAGELQQGMAIRLGMLMRPLVGDRILAAQMKRELIAAVASGLVGHAADIGAAKVLGGGPPKTAPTGPAPHLAEPPTQVKRQVYHEGQMHDVTSNPPVIYKRGTAATTSDEPVTAPKAVQPAQATRDLQRKQEVAAEFEEAQRGVSQEPGYRRDDPRWSQQAAQIEENAARGRLNEAYLRGTLETKLNNEYDNVADQVWVRPNRDDGKPADFYFIPDHLAGDRATGKVVAIDGKFGPSADLTNRQAIGYPMLARNGGTVMSRNQPLYPYGTKLPPTQALRAEPTVNLWTTPQPPQGQIDFTFTPIK